MHAKERKGYIMNSTPNREYKDSLFVTYLTEDPKRLIEVYNAVLGADLPSNSAVEVNTLDKVLYRGINNDLSFTVGGNLVVLIEDQSTINMNMPIRLLMYVARVYEKLLPSRAVYAEKMVKVPRPEFIVFYNGKDDMPDTIELKLSEAFKDAYAKETLELTLTVYNINPGHNEWIRSKSNALREYTTFVAKIHEYEKGGMSLAEAIGAGVKYALEHGIMHSFIRKHSSEVNNMLFVEYDPEEARKVAMEEGYEDGLEDGIAKGHADIVRRMKLNGRSTADIVADTGMSVKQIEKI
jgi:predicted transposase/invertase (TIGR01784 family)